MRNVTIYLPIPYLNMIKKLKKKKIVSSRSAAVRSALRDFLHEEFKFYEEITT